MTSSAFETVLDECLSRVQAGEPLEYCLEEYPQLADDLRPLLGVAHSVRSLPPPPLNQRQIDAGMALMLARVQGQPTSQERMRAVPAGPSLLEQLQIVISKLFKPALTAGFAVVAVFVFGVWIYTLRGGLPGSQDTTDIASVPIVPTAVVGEPTRESAASVAAAEITILPPPAVVTYEEMESEAADDAGPDQEAEVSELPMPDAAAPSLPVPAPTEVNPTGPSTTGPAVGGTQVGCSALYFFDPSPETCPRFPAQTSTGAAQPFENGWMIWLPNGDLAGSDLIYVLYDNGMYDVFVDSWVTGQPLGDDSLVVPAGLSQPIRGFGKIWREQPGVAAALGWATNGEFGYEITWQDEQPNDLEAVRYIELNETTIVQLSHSMQSGIWQSVPSP